VGARESRRLKAGNMIQNKITLPSMVPGGHKRKEDRWKEKKERKQRK
jgi:hypothetical protein